MRNLKRNLMRNIRRVGLMYKSEKEGYLRESDLQVMSFAKNSKTMMMLDKERYLELFESVMIDIFKLHFKEELER